MASLDEFIMENEVVGFHDTPILLKSGRYSHFYVNWRTVTADAFLLDRLTDIIVESLPKTSAAAGCQTWLGIPEGATKIAIVAAMKWAKASGHFGPQSHVISMARAQAKEHGDPRDRLVIGSPRGRILLIEDTMTTGGSTIKFALNLKNAGFEIGAVLCLTDRMQKRADGLSAAEAIRKELGPDVEYRALSHATGLIPLIAKRQGIGGSLKAAIDREFAEFGVMPLDWNIYGQTLRED